MYHGFNVVNLRIKYAGLSVGAPPGFLPHPGVPHPEIARYFCLRGRPTRVSSVAFFIVATCLGLCGVALEGDAFVGKTNLSLPLLLLSLSLSPMMADVVLLWEGCVFCARWHLPSLTRTHGLFKH